MSEDASGDAKSRKNRRTPKSRVGAPRASRSTRHQAKSPNKGFGGVHRRRNKHWSW